MEMPIDKALDALSVKRWALVDTTKSSTVADHSFSVAVIAMAIRSNMFNTNHFSEKDVCHHAILHDIREVLTGDIPTPVKLEMKKSGLNPDKLYPAIPEEDTPAPEVIAVVKMADLISNYVFICEHGVGGRARTASAEVGGRLSRAIDEAPPDLAAAAKKVLDYILTRKSDTDEERKRIAERGERYRQTAVWARSLITPVVD